MAVAKSRTLEHHYHLVSNTSIEVNETSKCLIWAGLCVLRTQPSLLLQHLLPGTVISTDAELSSEKKIGGILITDI